MARAPKDQNPKPAAKPRPRTPKTVPPANNGKHPGGRPSLYTPELVAEICKGLEAGNMRRAVAAYCGINKDTIQDWLNNKPEFSAQVRKAEAKAEYRCVIKVMFGQAGWQAAAWWLERKWHEDWGRRERVDMVLDTRKAAERALLDAGLPADEESVSKIVAVAEQYATSSARE
jgi:hypothetical protein